MRGLVAGAVLAGASLCSASANARVVQDQRYNFELTWNAAVRLIRVDLGYPITERDRDSGFVLFTVTEGGRTSSGSLEIVHADVEGVPGTRIIVQLAQMPIYMERYLMTRLGRKLHDEYGEPPPPAHHEPSPAPPSIDHPSDERHPETPVEPNAPAQPTRDPHPTR